MGDALTQGITRGADRKFSIAGGGYRPHLFELALGDGHDITFVGTMSDGPEMVAGRPFPANHEGHAGWLTFDFLDIIPTPALDFDPHIILLHAGAMDLLSIEYVSAAQNLVNLVSTITAHRPQTLIVLATLPDEFSDALTNLTRNHFNSTVRELAAASETDRIIVADLEELNIFLALFPREDGYRTMAQGWYDAIRPHL